MSNIEKYTVGETSNLKDVLQNLKNSGIGISIVVNKKKIVVGVLTDGDIRKKLIDGCKLTDSCSICINKNFSYLKVGYKREEALKLFDSRIRQIPVVNQKKQLVEIIKSPRDINLEINSVRSQSPARISLSGGGTDFSRYFLKTKGSSLLITTNLYARVLINKRNDSKIIINSEDLGLIKIFKNFEFLKNYKNKKLSLITAAITRMRPPFGFDMHIKCDFKPSSGLGGSAAVIASIIASLARLQQLELNKYEISELAFEIERLNLSIKGGWQDQYGTVFGGLCKIEFSRKNNIVYPISIDENILKEFRERLILCNLKTKHSGNIVQEYNQKNIDYKYNNKFKNIASKILEHLLKENYNEIGKCFDMAWKLKKQKNKFVSNKYINSIYAQALDNGALGGRLLGTGGGGHFIFYVNTEKKQNLIKFLKKNKVEIINFDFSSKGTQSWVLKKLK